MDILFSFVTVDTFWKVLLFVHFLVAAALLAAVTLQVATVVATAPVGAAAGGSADGARGAAVEAPSYATLVVVLYLLQALMGAWIYVKYRTYVRIPMEELRHWWTVGAFEFKEHVVAMGLGLLPAYWQFWRRPRPAQAVIRGVVTVLLAASVWYAFAVGHVASDFRGVGS